MSDEDENAEESIGDRIRSLRKMKGWSIDRLAREAGLAKNTVWEAEKRAGRKPWFQTLEPIATALDVPVLYLQTGKVTAPVENMADYSPELYFRMQGIRSPHHLRILSEVMADFKRLEQLTPTSEEDGDNPAE